MANETSAHTPGPWKATHNDDVPGFWSVSSPSGDVLYLSLQEEAVAANARLIAAAPDLLDALRWAANMAEEAVALRRDSDDPGDHEMLDHHEAALVTARAAIAKATSS